MKNSISVFILAVSCFTSVGLHAQESAADEQMLRKIYDMALTDGKAYDWLDHLSNEIGGRLSGSLEVEKAVQYTKEVMQEIGLDSVWLQPVMVPKWTRGVPEYSYISAPLLGYLLPQIS